MTGRAHEFPLAEFRSELRRRGDPHYCPVDLVRLELRCRGHDLPLSRVVEALCRAGYRVSFANNLALVALGQNDRIRSCADACERVGAEGIDARPWLPITDNPDAPSMLH